MPRSPVGPLTSVHVVAAALRDPAHARRVLIAQRPPGKWRAGDWEFPGGKVEPGESERQALSRELDEELGIEVLSARALGTFDHDYADRSVRIGLWLVTDFRGIPASRDGQALRWVEAAELGEAGLLEADLPMVPCLREALLREGQEGALNSPG